MIEAEVRFADFYLDFKHDIKKNLQLDADLPEILGDAADYSLCVSTLLLSSKDRMKDCPVKEIFIATSHDATHVIMTIQDGGCAISEVCKEVSREMDSAFDFAPLPEIDRVVCHALFLLKHNGARLQVQGERGRNRISLSIPYR